MKKTLRHSISLCLVLAALVPCDAKNGHPMFRLKLLIAKKMDRVKRIKVKLESIPVETIFNEKSERGGNNPI